MGNSHLDDELELIIQQLQQENTELKSQLEALQAYVGRLHEAYIGFCETDLEFVLHAAFDETPAQSLNNIKAQVEEETIERCKALISDNWDVVHYEVSLDDMPRKYKEQSNED